MSLAATSDLLCIAPGGLFFRQGADFKLANGIQRVAQTGIKMLEVIFIHGMIMIAVAGKVFIMSEMFFQHPFAPSNVAVCVICPCPAAVYGRNSL